MIRLHAEHVYWHLIALSLLGHSVIYCSPGMPVSWEAASEHVSIVRAVLHHPMSRRRRKKKGS